MNKFISVAVLCSLLSGAALACAPVVYVDKSGRELPEDQVVQIRFNASDYVIVGNVVKVEDIEEYAPTPAGRRRIRHYQSATVSVVKSWKSTKRVGDTLTVYADLTDSCSRALVLGTQPLIYASGPEPVTLSGWYAIFEQGLSSSHASTLDRIVLVQAGPEAPNKRLNAIAPKNGAPH